MAEDKTDSKATLIEGWERTNDIRGHKPKFEMVCARCKASLDKKTIMQVRHSGLKLSRNAMVEMYNKEHPPKEPWKPIPEEFDPEINMNGIAYKCPYCAWFIRFQIPDTREYLQEIYKKRDYSVKFIPVWETDVIEEDEQKKIGEQLENMGYWGGR